VTALKLKDVFGVVTEQFQIPLLANHPHHPILNDIRMETPIRGRGLRTNRRLKEEDV
jgi:hypothetical protein